MDLMADPRMFEQPLQAEKRYVGEGEDSPLLALENGFSGLDEADIEDAYVVEAPAREQHTVHVGEAAKVPAHIREALERLL